MALQQLPAQADDVLRLGLVQADGLDIAAQLVLAQGEQLLRGVRHRVEQGGGLVDADVGGLGGQHHRHQQLERAAVLQLAARIGVGRGEAAVQLGDIGRFHGLSGLLRFALARAMAAAMSMEPALSRRLGAARRRAAARACCSRPSRDLRAR